MPNVSVIGNLKTANNGVLLLLICAFPFDNALFHFSTFLLLTTFLLSVHVAGVDAFFRSTENVKPVHVAFLLVVLTMALSNVVNWQGLEAWGSMVKFGLRYWLLLAALYFLFDRDFLSLKVLFGASLLSLLFQIMPFIASYADGSIFQSRFSGFTHGPNVLGFLLAIGLLLSLHAASSKIQPLAISIPISMILACLFLVGLLATGSRGSWVAALVSSGLYFIVYMRKQIKILILTFVALCGTSAFVLTAFPLPLTRLKLLLVGYSALRDEVWLNALGLFYEKPILGHGLDTRQMMSENHFIYAEHNILLSIATTLGVLGLIVYGNLVYRISAPALRVKNYFPLILLSLLFSAGMFSFDFYRNQAFMFTFIIFAVLCLLPGSLKTGAPTSQPE